MNFQEKNQKIYLIKNKIDNYIRNLDIFKVSIENALEEILVRHSELIFFWTFNQKNIFNISNKYAKFDISDSNMESLIQESIKWAIKWAFDYCPVNSQFTKKFVMQDMLDLFELAYVYDVFFEQWWSFTKKRLDISIDQNSIRFINKNVNEKYFASYNYWRQSIRNEKIIEEISVTSSNHDVVSLMSKVQKREFEVTKNWDFGTFKYKDLINFSIALDQYLNEANIMPSKVNIIMNMRSNAMKYIIVKSKEEWVSLFSMRTDLISSKIEAIIDIFTYNPHNKCEISHQFFIPLKNKLAISSRFVGISVRPERNFLSMLPKIDKMFFDKISNDFEEIQKQKIIKLIAEKNNNLLFSEGTSRKQALRPGMDLLVLDKSTLKLLVVELKYNIPPSTAAEVTRVDKKLHEGVSAIKIAKNYIKDNLKTVMREYFGNHYEGALPTDYEGIVITNEEIGTGHYVEFNSPIITIDHFIEVLKKDLNDLFLLIRNGFRGYPTNGFVETEIEVVIQDNKLLIPSYIPNLK